MRDRRCNNDKRTRSRTPRDRGRTRCRASLRSELRLCQRLAAQGDPNYGKVAVRFVKRLRTEAHASAEQATDAAAALVMLRLEPGAARPVHRLEELVDPRR